MSISNIAEGIGSLIARLRPFGILEGDLYTKEVREPLIGLY